MFQHFSVLSSQICDLLCVGFTIPAARKSCCHLEPSYRGCATIADKGFPSEIRSYALLGDIAYQLLQIRFHSVFANPFLILSGKYLPVWPNIKVCFSIHPLFYYTTFYRRINRFLLGSGSFWPLPVFLLAALRPSIPRKTFRQSARLCGRFRWLPNASGHLPRSGSFG